MKIDGTMNAPGYFSPKSDRLCQEVQARPNEQLLKRKMSQHISKSTQKWLKKPPIFFFTMTILAYKSELQRKVQTLEHTVA